MLNVIGIPLIYRDGVCHISTINGIYDYYSGRLKLAAKRDGLSGFYKEINNVACAIAGSSWVRNDCSNGWVFLSVPHGRKFQIIACWLHVTDGGVIEVRDTCDGDNKPLLVVPYSKQKACKEDILPVPVDSVVSSDSELDEGPPPYTKIECQKVDKVSHDNCIIC